jgi:hypothetical protein
MKSRQRTGNDESGMKKAGKTSRHRPRTVARRAIRDLVAAGFDREAPTRQPRGYDWVICPQDSRDERDSRRSAKAALAARKRPTEVASDNLDYRRLSPRPPELDSTRLIGTRRPAPFLSSTGCATVIAGG